MSDAKVGGPTCNTCTKSLVETAYRRKPWFRLIREPMRIGTMAMARVLRTDPSDHRSWPTECQGCMRFQKTALKEGSALFRALNRTINPFFDRMLLLVVTEDEMEQARCRSLRNKR